MTAVRELVLVEPPARTSNEIEIWRAIPETPLTVVSDRPGWGAHRTVELGSRGLPLVGRLDGWSATPRWLVGLDRVALGHPTALVSLELFSFCTAQVSRLARQRGLPHIVHVAETMADNPLYRFPPYRTITRRCGVTADAFVCTTERARDHAVELGCPADRTHVVHLGIDTDAFSPATTRRPVTNRVVFVGALRADRGVDKGVFDIVNACRRARAAIPDLQLTIVGEGPLRTRLESVAGAESWIDVVGSVPRDKLPALMRSASVFALGSKRTWKWEEQFGYVLVEAMACGLPVVATRSGAIPEVVPAANPLAAEGDVAALAEGIEQMLGPSGDVVGDQNRTVAVERYNADTQGQRLASVLDAVVERHAAHR